MVALTVPELQRLLPVILPARPHRNTDTGFHLAWSEWRRRQARARWHHYRARLASCALPNSMSACVHVANAAYTVSEP